MSLNTGAPIIAWRPTRRAPSTFSLIAHLEPLTAVGIQLFLPLLVSEALLIGPATWGVGTFRRGQIKSLTSAATSQSEYVANFSHRHVYSASLSEPMSIRAIDQVCPQAILPMSVTLFPFGMLCVTNISSISCNALHFVPNWTGNTLVSVLCTTTYSYWGRYTYVCKFEKLSISRKKNFDLSLLAQILTKDKNAPSIASTHR